MAARYWVKKLDELPQVADHEPRAPVWYPLQHHFGFSAFGANVYVGKKAGDELIGEHDEGGSGQEELYVVLSGEARFELDGEEIPAPAVSVVALPDPAVRRRAVAVDPGTTMLAVGGAPREDFAPTWRSEWFEGVPRVG